MRVLWEQLNSFVVLLLIAASAVSALLGEWIDALAILAIVVLNTVLGIVQERRAEQALAALKKLAAPEAQVLRDGRRQVIPARELVPGDMVFLEAGNYVPADVRLWEAINLRVEEASLTGESLPVQKNSATVLDRNVPLGDRKNTAFMGTLVSYGRGRGVVTSTGMNTQLGLIARMLQSVEVEVTPLQRRLDQLGRSLSIGALVLVAAVFVVDVINNTPIASLFSAPLAYIAQNAKTDHRCIPDRCQPGDRGGAGGLAGGRDHQPGARHARDDPPPRADPQAGVRGNTGFGQRHLLGQDRHAYAERNDGHASMGGRNLPGYFRLGLCPRWRIHAGGQSCRRSPTTPRR